MLKKLREIKGSNNIKPANIKSQWAAIKNNGYKFSEIKDWANTVYMYFKSLPDTTETIGKMIPGGVAEEKTHPEPYNKLKEHAYEQYISKNHGEKKEVDSLIFASLRLAEIINNCKIKQELTEAHGSIDKWTECPEK